MSSPACASTPTSSRGHRRGGRARPAGRAARANGCRSSSSASPGRTRPGGGSACRTGTAGGGAGGPTVRGAGREVACAAGAAVCSHAGLPVVPIRWVLVRDPAGKFKPQAFLCTDETVDPTRILRRFVLRWRLEVTFEEGRRHLGVETQRQWSDKAIARTTPALLALFSLVALWAAEPLAHTTRSPRRASWYAKPELTFSDALAAVRQCLWRPEGLATSRPSNDVVKVSRALLERLTDTLCYAA